jgi:signal transduction histidine kinase
MPRSHSKPSFGSSLHLPRRTLRTRLTLLYGGLFLASGAVLIAFADVLVLGLRSNANTNERGTAQLPVVPPSGHQPGTDLRQVLIYSGIALAVMAVASLPLGWMMAGRALRPFRTMMATARRISASSLHDRLDIDGPYDEFAELGQTLDDLFSRLEASFESQRHFVANASHELRTPLTAERALLQVALANPEATTETLRSTCKELLILGHQQERLIDALLTLASSERGVEHWESVDLAVITEKVLLVRHEEADRRGIHIDAALGAAPVTGDVDLIESLVTNVVDNSIRHNVPGGWIKISTTATEGGAKISVRNTGPVIPPDEVDRLFQPFQRLGHERVRDTTGHGLGLAIVDAIANAHGASLTARSRPAGGLDVEVSFASRVTQALVQASNNAHR